MFYEEVPGRPAFLLRALLPYPVRTEGDKTRVGATVRCAYRGGELAKRITTTEPPHLLQFDVIEQRLGIEGCILTRGGSYQIETQGDASDVVLITNYQAYLRPRYLWRPLEALLVDQLHVHILRGIGAAVLRRNPAVGPAVAGIPHITVRRPGGVTCTASQSGFPPLVVIRASVAAVWLYEGLWCKILGRVPSQVEVVTAVPRLGPRFGSPFLKALGIVEVAIAVWVMVGIAPALCAIAQTALLVVLNANGLLWARHIIHDPVGMVVKNIAFLVLAWVCGAIPGGRL